MWALVDDNPIRYLGIKLGFNELSDQSRLLLATLGDLAQSIHYHSVGMIIALKLLLTFE
ncbi:hypothetical protein THF1C08_230096 [Vibrio jasicida]|nr:hypothetical protein THF1C08_230096 [Vibrio jasicida]